MNENVLPFNSQRNGKKNERILIVRLSEGSEVLEAASIDVDEKSESLCKKFKKARHSILTGSGF